MSNYRVSVQGGALYCTVLYCTVCCSVRGGSRHLLPPADPHLPAAHPHHAPLLPLLRRASGPGQHQLRVICLASAQCVNLVVIGSGVFKSPNIIIGHLSIRNYAHEKKQKWSSKICYDWMVLGPIYNPMQSHPTCFDGCKGQKEQN